MQTKCVANCAAQNIVALQNDERFLKQNVVFIASSHLHGACQALINSVLNFYKNLSLDALL